MYSIPGVSLAWEGGLFMLRGFFLFLLILLTLPGTSPARSLYWQDMKVNAELDREGRLHVLEQQTMVFTGAWNGGERRFNLRPGQRLDVHNVYRIDSDGGTRVPLVQGNLARVDHWVWHDRTTLRWRARLPSDPPFTHKAITYLLDYTLSGILFPVQGGYQLSHDFAFPERVGVIEHFSLDLILDSSWQPLGNLPTHLQRNSLPPGTSVILSAVLAHPDGIPAAVAEKSRLSQKPTFTAALPVSLTSTPVWLRSVVIVSLWILALAQGVFFLGHERKLGRFHALIPVDHVNVSWLEQHVFSLAPEVVGAIWDKKTDSSEVAAVLARMVLENKMSSRVEQDVIPWLGWKIPGSYTLHLQLLVSRSTLGDYERELVDGLFIDGDATSTKKVKKYYRRERKTFNPVEKVRQPLQRRVDALTKDRKNPLEMIWLPTAFVAAAGFFLLFADFFLHPFERVMEMMIVGSLIIIWVVGVNLALAYRATAESVRTRAYQLWVSALIIAAAYMALLILVDCSILLTLGSACLCAASINNILNLARSRDSVDGVRLHRRLASARRYFKEELNRKAPDIRDAWFPYLVAFGLGPRVDSWFRRYGGHSTVSGSPISGGSSAGFTGGGGQFGGGGVSGAWSAAAGSMSASASGSSSGGAGGGGGSGGGGGGGF